MKANVAAHPLLIGLCALGLTVACGSSGRDDEEARPPADATSGGNDGMGAGAGRAATGGTPGSGATGGTTALGGVSAGGTSTSDTATGGTSSGGESTGGTVAGGTSSGGSATGGTATGAASTGGTSSGGSVTGGAGTGGESNGGASTGGAANGGESTGGAATGGESTGGAATGGANTGGDATGGTSSGGTTATTPVGRHGQLQVVGSEVQDEHGAPVTLRGQGFGWDNWWPQYYNADVVAWLRQDWCVDMVRPAMGIEPDGAYLADPAASKARIQAVVDAAIAEDIYVIIDWHAHDLHQAEATAFFTEMAQRYGDRPHVIYEIFNEPEGETWPEVKAYAEAVIAAIRQHDPDNLVIVGCPEWDQRIDLVAADPITAYDNIVYAVHFYAATHGQWLRDRTADALADGVPVIVSESSGSESTGLGANNTAEWEAWFDFMDSNHISWINYSVSDKEGETISVLEPGATASGGWGAAELTETGETIRGVFLSYCD